MGEHENEDSANAFRCKIARMNLLLVKFYQIDSSYDRKIVWYYSKNVKNTTNYHNFVST